MAEQGMVYFQLRIPADLHERVKALAEKQERSQHWIGLRALRLGVEQLEQQQQAS